MYLMPFKARHASAVSSVEASSTTTTSTSVPAASALSTARCNRCGRLCVGMMTLMRAIECCDVLVNRVDAPSAPTASRVFPSSGSGQFDFLTVTLESSQAPTPVALASAEPPASSSAGILPLHDSPQSVLARDGGETLR